MAKARLLEVECRKACEEECSLTIGEHQSKIEAKAEMKKRREQ